MEETNYPFEETVRIKVDTPKEVAFPLYFRVPRWSGAPQLELNGKAVDVTAAPSSYLVVERAWKSGDTVALRFPMKTEVQTWAKNHNSVSVSHGPLTYALHIQEQWKQSGGNADWPEYEVFPTSAWNYGLVLNGKHPERSFELQEKSAAVSPNPFTPDAVPVTMKAKARKIPGWQPDSESVIGVLQPSPAKSSEPLETVTLIPMGAARLRISSFPIIGTGKSAHTWSAVPPDEPAKA